MITGLNFLGRTKSAQGEVTFSTFNPITNSHTEWEFTEATTEEINKASYLAASAFNDFREVSAVNRAKFLRRIAKEIEELGDMLLETYVLETGLPEGRARGERGRTIGQLKAFAELLEEGSYVDAVIETADPERTPFPKPDIRNVLVPIGPIAVFGSSNFPLAFSTAGGDTASALAAGCPVIVKCHPFHAATSELVAGAIIKAAEATEMPDGVFSHLLSKDHRVGSTLVSHAAVKGVGFTGSLKGGTALNKLVQQRDEPIPFFAEMGSTNPVILLPSALKTKGKSWAEQLAASIVLGAGQFCTNPGLIIGIKGMPLDAFIRNLGKELEEKAPQCMLHPSIHDHFKLKCFNLKNDGELEVISLTNTDNSNYAAQSLFHLSGDAYLKNPDFHEEIFGPVSIVVSCDDEEQLKEVILSLKGQLTGTIIGAESELEQYRDLVTSMQEKIGRILFNGVPTGVEVNAAMHHGGPYPATTDSRYTSVGSRAIRRWLRPLCYQNWPDTELPPALQNANPLSIYREVNKILTKAPLP